MKLIVILPLILITIPIYAGFFHLYLYIRQRENRANLTFFFYCLYMVFFELFCYLSYSASSIDEALYWRQFQFIALAVFPLTFLHIIYDFTEQKTRKIPWILTGAVLLIGIPLIIANNILAPAEPIERYVPIIDYTYYISRGINDSIIYIYILSTCTYGIILGFCSYKKGNKTILPILIICLFYYITGLNDIMVDLGLYSFIYLTEYGALLLIIGMAYALINRYVEINEELRKKNALSAIGKMASEVVHDLTNPLNTIKTAAQIAREDSSDLKEQEKYLSLIESQTKRLSDMAMDILQFVKGDNAIAVRKINVKEYMDEIYNYFKFSFNEQGIDLQYYPEYKGEIYIDPERFKRAVYNIIFNAQESFAMKRVEAPETKHIPSKEKSSQHTSSDEKAAPPRKNRLIISVKRNNDKIQFHFKDNGPGIPEHLRDQIFEPFISYRKKSSTGLGLAIVKQIIEQHNGAVTYESKENEGTDFIITVPFKTS